MNSMNKQLHRLEAVPDRLSREELLAVSDEPILLNLGCGKDTDGIGIDINYKPDIRHNLNDGIPVESNSVERIKCHHVLEHLESPITVLREIKRVLKSNGEASIIVPNVGWWPVRLWISVDLQHFWDHKDPNEGGHWLARWIGNQDPDRTPHKTLYSKRMLSIHFETAGLKYVINNHHFSRNLQASVWID